MDSQTFAGPVIGIFCSGLNAYCMQTRPLFLRISGSSGVLKAFLLERNRQLSCNPKKKKKKKKKTFNPMTNLTKKQVPFQWTEECNKAFLQLKRALTTAPVLALLD